jgi:hypothetical protein
LRRVGCRKRTVTKVDNLWTFRSLGFGGRRRPLTKPLWTALLIAAVGGRFRLRRVDASDCDGRHGFDEHSMGDEYSMGDEHSMGGSIAWASSTARGLAIAARPPVLTARSRIRVASPDHEARASKHSAAILSGFGRSDGRSFYTGRVECDGPIFNTKRDEKGDQTMG